jgi:hypothetical protein
MISRCILKSSQSSGDGLIVEVDILTSAPTGELHPDTHQPFVPLPAGTDGTWWQGLTDKNVALPAIKSFVFAVLNLGLLDPRRTWLEQPVPGSEHWRCNKTRRPMALIESLMIWATEEPNIFQGLFLHLDTKFTKTKKGGPFTIHNWHPQPQALIQPAQVDQFLSQARTEPRIAEPPAQSPVPTWGQGPSQSTWGPPAAPQAPPQAPPGWSPPPTQAPPWGQPPPVQAPPWGQPPPSWTPPPGAPSAPPSPSPPWARR